MELVPNQLFVLFKSGASRTFNLPPQTCQEILRQFDQWKNKDGDIPIIYRLEGVNPEDDQQDFLLLILPFEEISMMDCLRNP